MILAATSLDSFVQLITVLIIFVFVLILTYFTTDGWRVSRRGEALIRILELLKQ